MNEVLHIVVRGRVQGVGFRDFVSRTAHRLGIDGWVRNRSDGTVEVLAAVPPARKESFLNALRSGPAMARVEGLDARRAPEGHEVPEGFQVRF